MSGKARRRPTWKVKHRRYPTKYQTARYRLPYCRYWTISFYNYWDMKAEQYIARMDNGTLKAVQEYCETVKKDYGL